MGWARGIRLDLRRRGVPRTRRAVRPRQSRTPGVRHRRPGRAWTTPAYDALQPVRWPLPAGAISEGGRLFAQGGFPTADGRARLVPVTLERPAGPRRSRAAAEHRPGARPVAHHDPHRSGAEPDDAYAGAAARPSSRPTPPRPGIEHGAPDARLTTADGEHPAARRGDAMASAAARCSRRCTGPTSSPRRGPVARVVGARRGSDLRPAGTEGDAGRYRAGRRRISHGTCCCAASGQSTRTAGLISATGCGCR